MAFFVRNLWNVVVIGSLRRRSASEKARINFCKDGGKEFMTVIDWHCVKATLKNRSGCVPGLGAAEGAKTNIAEGCESI